jgi:hypothetical protein
MNFFTKFLHYLGFIWLTSFTVAFAGPPVPSEVRFGPEMEFRGVKQIPSVVCAGDVYAISGSVKDLALFGRTALTAGLIGTAVFYSSDQSDLLSEVVRQASYAAIVGGGLVYGYGAFCGKIRHISDRAYDRKLESALIDLCSDGHCHMEPYIKSSGLTRSLKYRDFKVTYPDGREVHFTHDPSVIEVKSSPLTALQAESIESSLQQDVFDTLKKIGLKPAGIDSPWNSGHVHIGVDTFTNPGHLERFLSEFLKHPELSDGILGNDQISAPSLGSLACRSRLKEAIAGLAHAVPGEPVSLYPLFVLTKDMTCGLVYNRNLKTLEMRFPRAQKDAKTLTLLFKLFNAKILQHQNGSEIARVFDEDIAVPVTYNEKVRNFRKYVEEAGLDWKDYESFVPSRWSLGVSDCINRTFVRMENLINKRQRF